MPRSAGPRRSGTAFAKRCSVRGRASEWPVPSSPSTGLCHAAPRSFPARSSSRRHCRRAVRRALARDLVAGRAEPPADPGGGPLGRVAAVQAKGHTGGSARGLAHLQRDVSRMRTCRVSRSGSVGSWNDPAAYRPEFAFLKDLDQDRMTLRVRARRTDRETSDAGRGPAARGTPEHWGSLAARDRWNDGAAGREDGEALQRLEMTIQDGRKKHVSTTIGLMSAVTSAINTLEEHGYVAPYACVFGRSPFEAAHKPVGASTTFPRDRIEPLIGRELLHASAIDVPPAGPFRDTTARAGGVAEARVCSSRWQVMPWISRWLPKRRRSSGKWTSGPLRLLRLRALCAPHQGPQGHRADAVRLTRREPLARRRRASVLPR